jgi:hypothetical protein
LMWCVAWEMDLEVFIDAHERIVCKNTNIFTI